RRLDLDDIGALLGEEQHAERARDAPREVEDADAVERASHWAVSLAQRRRTCQAGLAAAALPRPPTPIASFASRLRAGEHMAITGAHVLLYTSQPEELRAVLRDVFGWEHVDARDGWLIFALPPAELGVHPAESPSHELTLM